MRIILAERAVSTADITQTSASLISQVWHHRALESQRAIGGYRLQRMLGRGGFAEVWEAEEETTGRRIALKLLVGHRHASPGARERFAQEGRLAARLNHPRCVFVFAAENIEGIAAVAMELMPGGTLQDELSARGRLAPAHAVDRMMDVLDGLEAAHANGIVHRDVKPSNCFIDAEGRVKVGDFGISKTLVQDLPLTQSGAFVGTPVYASPEQMRGRDVDLRSDIYSAGATLYALLTGTPPFGGAVAGEVLARVLTERPPPINRGGTAVPAALERVLQRMMAKDRAERYQTIEEVRVALRPFSSTGLSPASLALRPLALVVDLALWFPFTLFLARAFSNVQTSVPLAALLASVFGSPLLYYFAFAESRWGQTLGKRLFRLRVSTASGAPPSFPRAWIRAVILFGVPGLLYVLVQPGVRAGAVMNLFMRVLPLVTMRRSNGFACVHDLATGTRVTIALPANRIQVPSHALVGSPDPLAPAAIGPYRRQAVLWSSAGEELLLAFDDVLSRQVWIHRYNSGDHPALRNIGASADPHRLRWLTGTCAAGLCWDAYEAPTGIGLAEWVARHGRLTWREMRPILTGLVAEFASWNNDGDSANRLWSVQHVWIDSSGEVKLLEFPVMPAQDVPLVSARWLLLHVAIFGLDGRLVSEADLAGTRPAAPLPDYADLLMDALRAGMAPGEVLERFRSTAGRPSSVTRTRRFGPLLAAAGTPVLLIVLPVTGMLMGAAVLRGTPIGHLIESSAVLRLDAVRLSADERDAHEHIVAGLYVRLKGTPTMSVLPPADIDRFEALAKRYPDVSQQDLDAALGVVTRLGRPSPFVPDARVMGLMSQFALQGFAFAAAAVVVLSTALRGPIFRMAGLSLKTSHGERASRGRHFLRSVIAASPFLPFLVLWHPSPGTSIFLMVGVGTVLTAAAVWAIVSPHRGLPDVIAATCIVPR